MCDVHDVTTFGTLHTNQHPMLALSDQCTCHGLLSLGSKIGSTFKRKKKPLTESQKKSRSCNSLRALAYPDEEVVVVKGKCKKQKKESKVVSV